jgi:hypothetical protein
MTACLVLKSNLGSKSGDRTLLVQSKKFTPLNGWYEAGVHANSDNASPGGGAALEKGTLSGSEDVPTGQLAQPTTFVAGERGSCPAPSLHDLPSIPGEGEEEVCTGGGVDRLG